MPSDLREDPRMTPVTLLTARQVGELLGVHQRHVWRMASAGHIPAPIRLGTRVVRWRLRDLQEHIAAAATE